MGFYCRTLVQYRELFVQDFCNSRQQRCCGCCCCCCTMQAAWCYHSVSIYTHVNIYLLQCSAPCVALPCSMYAKQYTSDWDVHTNLWIGGKTSFSCFTAVFGRCRSMYRSVIISCLDVGLFCDKYVYGFHELIWMSNSAGCMLLVDDVNAVY